MAGFILGNTLSENGAVTRGVCKVDSEGNLAGVTETSDIYKTETGAGVPDGKGGFTPLDPASLVSMNMWGFTPELFDILEEGFKEFLSNIKEGDVKAEYLIPAVVDQRLKEGKASVTVLKTHDKWFGVTYKEDKESVVNSFKALIDAGAYPVSSLQIINQNRSTRQFLICLATKTGYLAENSCQISGFLFSLFFILWYGADNFSGHQISWTSFHFLINLRDVAADDSKADHDDTANNQQQQNHCGKSFQGLSPEIFVQGLNA